MEAIKGVAIFLSGMSMPQAVIWIVAQIQEGNMTVALRALMHLFGG